MGRCSCWGRCLTAYACNSLGLGFWVATLAAPLVVAALMLLLDRVLFTRVLGRDMTVSILATAGLLLVVDNVVLALFGGEPVSVDAPLEDAVEFFGISYPSYRLVAAGIAIVVLLAFGAFLKYTRYGLFMRAVPQARALAATTGVPIARVNALTIALGGLTAGLAGALATPITGAHFQMGLAILAPSFIVVVVGGARQPRGEPSLSPSFTDCCAACCRSSSHRRRPRPLRFWRCCRLLYWRPNGLFGAT